jgi:hypothetical protein
MPVAASFAPSLPGEEAADTSPPLTVSALVMFLMVSVPALITLLGVVALGPRWGVIVGVVATVFEARFQPRWPCGPRPGRAPVRDRHERNDGRMSLALERSVSMLKEVPSHLGRAAETQR